MISEDISVPRLNQNEFDDALNHHHVHDAPARRGKTARAARQPSRATTGSNQEPPAFRTRMRRNETGEFRCGHCRRMIGPTVSGGKHRNHCPFCLASRHVDMKRPGDRESPCRAMMPAIGSLFREDGEQMILHRCNGCGIERRNRIAADDHPVALLRLEPVSLVPEAREVREEITGEAIA